MRYKGPIPRRLILQSLTLAIHLLFLAAGGRSDAATYFVDPNGSDANPGSQAQPWATLPKAAASVQPGDLVRIKAGQYTMKGQSFRRAGTEAAPSPADRR
jgi:hypothetical protein